MSEQEINNIFAKNLIGLINRRGLSQVDVANYVGVSEASVSLWCSGKNTPRMSKVDKLCELLNCNRSALLDDDGLAVLAEAERNAALQAIYDKNKILFDAADNATPEQIQQAAQYLEFLKTQR